MLSNIDGVSTSKKYLGSFIVRLSAGVMFINLFIIALAGILIHQSKVQYEESAAHNTQNLAHISAEYIEGVIDKINLTLVIVADEVEKQSSKGRIIAPDLNLFLSQAKVHLLEIDCLRISDSQGKLQFCFGSAADKPDNIADRDFFIKLRDVPNAKLVISKPELVRSTGRWNVTFARRLSRPDSAFAGVVYTEVRLEHFLKVFTSLDLGENGSIALRNRDLTLMSRFSKSEGLISSSIGQKNVSRKFQELVDSGQKNVTYKAKYPVDGIERTYTYHEIDGVPLIVNVGLAASDYLAAWRNETSNISASVFVFFLISLIISQYIYKNWQRRQLILNELQESEESFRSIFEYSLVGSILSTPEGQIVKVNYVMENLFGYMAAEFMSMNIKELTFPDDYDVDQEMYLGMLEGWRNYYQIEKRFVSNHGIVIWGMLSASVVRDRTGCPRYVVYMIDDISARKGAEEQLNYESTHDSMTGLRNRAYFDGEFSRMQLGLSFPVSIIIIDLDGLKKVNDLQGHGAGDRLITALAAIMREALQEHGLKARIGGDEFAVLLPGTDEENTEAVMERLRQCQVAHNERESKFPVHFSMGAATAYSGDQLTCLWKQADDRMYAEKALHKGAIQSSL